MHLHLKKVENVLKLINKLLEKKDLLTKFIENFLINKSF